MNSVISEAFLPSQQEWMGMFNAFEDMMFVLDGFGHVVLANEKALVLIEKEMHELYGQSFEEFFMELGIHPGLNFIRRALSEKTPAEEYCFSDGKHRWFHCTVYPPKSESGTALVRFTDVTGKYENLRRIKMLGGIIEQLNEGVCLTDAQGKIIYANRAKCLMTGYDSSSELAGRGCEVFLSDENPPELRNEVLNESRKNGWRGDILFRRKNAESFPGYLSTTPLYDMDGNVTHIVGLCHDTSEQKALQERLLHTEKLSSLSSLVSGVAHEINNPLSTGCVRNTFFTFIGNPFC